MMQWSELPNHDDVYLPNELSYFPAPLLGNRWAFRTKKNDSMLNMWIQYNNSCLFQIDSDWRNFRCLVWQRLISMFFLLLHELCLLELWKSPTAKELAEI